MPPPDRQKRAEHGHPTIWYTPPGLRMLRGRLLPYTSASFWNISVLPLSTSRWCLCWLMAKLSLLLGGHGGTSTWYGWHGIVDGGALGLVLLPGTCGSADLEGGFKDVWLFGAWKTAGGSCWMRVSLA
eukprot:CAMPEP_0202415240 /NCGR_PEP_ID=MMETSP1128-20130828/35447_1 /ASSEMBLY_ACC=CAM_ASM_000463 /TAXON_ID=3047 /ORGANISM="Dunaliella tertiolecta, Strain CCMP1320" /LENGTH=127 /DNA_ID=CAMNT_0049021869 /DNA_START=1575 /DNA_END=1958 /DNA_ORIENTATION=+